MMQKAEDVGGVGAPAGRSGPLRWWMGCVGALYVVLGVPFVPAVNHHRIGMVVPGFAAAPGSVERAALLDWMFLFGLETAVIGAALLVGARRPSVWLPLVWTVLALEVVRGVLFDIYYITQGYVPAGFYVGFIVLHLVVIATGLGALRALGAWPFARAAESGEPRVENGLARQMA